MRKLKILLAAIYSYPMDENLEEIGISSITAFLRENGYEVLLLGAMESKLDYGRIIEFIPDIVGFPVYNVSKDSVYKACRRLKTEFPEVRIVLGGSLPTYYGVEMMKENSDIDFIIKGEGELAFLELTHHIEDHRDIEDVRGLIYRKGDTIISNKDQDLIKDLDMLPPPARDLLVDNNIRFAQVLTSRGCTRNCSFCCSNGYWKKWRGRDIKKVIDEVESIVNTHSTKLFYFIDSSFEDPGLNYKRVKQIVEEIISRQINISYYIYLRADFHKIADRELTELLKKSGLCGVMLGIDTANEADRKLYGKIPTLEDSKKTMELFQRENIIVNVGFININPYSTFDSLRTNIDFLETYGLAAVIPHIMSTYRLYKGTKLYDKIQEDGLLREGEYHNFYRYDFVDQRIERLVKYMDEYLRPLSYEMNRIYHFACDYMFNLVHYRRIFEGNGHQKAFDAVDKQEKEVKDILSYLNTRNSKCIRKLFELAENSLCEDTATQLLEEFAVKKYTVEALQKLEMKRLKLNYRLIKLNSQYEKILF